MDELSGLQTVDWLLRVLGEARKGRGLSQSDMAEAVGISRSHVSRIESGAVDNPSLRTVFEMVETLDLSPLDVVGASMRLGRDSALDLTEIVESEVL